MLSLFEKLRSADPKEGAAAEAGLVKFHQEGECLSSAKSALSDDPLRYRSVIPALVEALSWDGHHVPCLATSALTAMGGQAVPDLIEAMVGRDAASRESIGLTIALIGEGAVPGLRAAIRSPRADIRRSAIEAVFAFGRWNDSRLAARALLPDLDACLSDPDLESHVLAASAVLTLDPGAAERREELRKRLALLVPSQTAALKDPSPLVRRRAALLLREAGPAAAAALPALLDALSDTVPWVVGRSLEAIGKIGPAAADAVPILTEMIAQNLRCLNGSEMGRCQLAAEALGRIGPAAASAASVLETAARSDRVTVREAAEVALRRIRGG